MVGVVCNCNFCSYGFLLVGYMIVLIGLFVLQYLDGVFMSVMMCVVEIMVGIVLVGVVSVFVFLQIIGEQMCMMVCKCFGSFVDYVVVVLLGQFDCVYIEIIYMCFVVDVVGFEVVCSMVVFEDLDMWMCSGCFVWLNSEFMSVLSWFYVLYQLMNWLYVVGVQVVIDVIELYFCEIVLLLLIFVGELVCMLVDVGYVVV